LAVWCAFKGLPPEGAKVHHGEGGVLDCSIGNLELLENNAAHNRKHNKTAHMNAVRPPQGRKPQGPDGKFVPVRVAIQQFLEKYFGEVAA